MSEALTLHFSQMLAPATPARHLEADDMPWATELLIAALTEHPVMRYICQGPAEAEQKRWLLQGLLRFGMRYGTVYANAGRTALAIWLPPGRVAITPARLLRAGLLPAAPWRLGLAGFKRLRRLLRASSWLRRQSLSTPHHHLLALVVHPDAQGLGVGRRLLLATLAVRRTAQAPSYLSTQVPAHLPFYQRLGFQVVGHCSVGEGPTALIDWGMLRTPRA
ncbi:GNAT family N-acetyltransferase [Hymenobacter saemangeumensis]